MPPFRPSEDTSLWELAQENDSLSTDEQLALALGYGPRSALLSWMGAQKISESMALAQIRQGLPRFVEEFEKVLTDLEPIQYTDTFFTEGITLCIPRLRVLLGLLLQWREKSTSTLEELGAVVHEVNQPFTAILGGLSILVDESASEEAEPLVDMSQKGQVVALAERLCQLNTTNRFFSSLRYAAKSHYHEDEGVEHRSPVRRAAQAMEEAKTKLALRPGETLLSVEDDVQLQAVLNRLSTKAEALPHHAHDRVSLAATLSKIPRGTLSVVILDNDLRNGLWGHQLVAEIREHSPDVFIIVHTGDIGDAAAMAPYIALGLPTVEKADMAGLNACLTSRP